MTKKDYKFATKIPIKEVKGYAKPIVVKEPNLPHPKVKQEPKPEPKLVECKLCDGRGIRPEINERVLCPDCSGHGQVETK